MHGDCLELMKQIPEHSVDFILTDPPFGTTKCKWDVVIPFEDMWKCYHRVIKPGGVIALFGTEPFSSHLRISNLKEFKYDWIWDKMTGIGHLVAKKRPLSQHEVISIFVGTQYYPIKILRDKPIKAKEYNRSDIVGGESHGYTKIYTDMYPKTIISISSKKEGERLAPTQKPVSLLQYLIRTYTQEGETVLDSCMGSGSTAIACLNTNRNFIGIEKDDHYFQVASDRIAAHEQKLRECLPL
jgi:site-specific DNA-methyltransferase (adenine-specific)